MLKNVRAKMKRFMKEEVGASAIEYAVIAAVVIVIGLAAFLGVGGIGTKMDTKFDTISTALN